MDSNTTFAAVKEKIEQFVQERDWAQFHNPKDLSISLAIEAAELMEIFQWKQHKPPVEVKKEAHTMEKIEKNKKKYPVEKAKGKATKYTEL